VQITLGDGEDQIIWSNTDYAAELDLGNGEDYLLLLPPISYTVTSFGMDDDVDTLDVWTVMQPNLDGNWINPLEHWEVIINLHPLYSYLHVPYK
jgi:hypothetical protein